MGELNDFSLRGPFAFIHRAGPVVIPFVFPIAPQHVKLHFPARGAVHQAFEGNWLDDFSGKNAVLATGTLRGTFGYHPKVGPIGGPFGSQYMAIIEHIFEVFNQLDRTLKRDTKATQEYVSLQRLHYWRVWIDVLEYEIDSRDPLLFYYNIHFFRLEDLLFGGGSFGSSTLGSLGASVIKGLF